MTIRRMTPSDCEPLVPLVAAFRVTLKSYKRIVSEPDLPAALCELEEYFAAGFPVYAAFEGDLCAGYAVLRVEEPCVWVESLFVDPAFRRRGVASALFVKAEELARSYGETTVYNYVHPNTRGMIAFLNSRGYNMLNLIEIRRPYAGETPAETVRVNDHDFDY